MTDKKMTDAEKRAFLTQIRRDLERANDKLSLVKASYGISEFYDILDKVTEDSSVIELAMARSIALEEVVNFTDITRLVYKIVSISSPSKDIWIESLSEEATNLSSVYDLHISSLTKEDLEFLLIDEYFECHAIETRVSLKGHSRGSSYTGYTDEEVQYMTERITKRIIKNAMQGKTTVEDCTNALYKTQKDFKKMNNLTDEDLAVMKLQGLFVPKLK